MVIYRPFIPAKSRPHKGLGLTGPAAERCNMVGGEDERGPHSVLTIVLARAIIGDLPDGRGQRVPSQAELSASTQIGKSRYHGS